MLYALLRNRYPMELRENDLASKAKYTYFLAFLPTNEILPTREPTTFLVRNFTDKAIFCERKKSYMFRNFWVRHQFFFWTKFFCDRMSMRNAQPLKKKRENQNFWARKMDISAGNQFFWPGNQFFWWENKFSTYRTSVHSQFFLQKISQPPSPPCRLLKK